MLQSQGIPAQQANLYPNPAQPQQFQPSPSVQNAQMPLPMNNVQPQINQPNNNTAQQLEAFFRSHPEMEKSERAQAINQIMMRAKQAGTSINMGSLSQNPQQTQQPPQQQQQRPHPVGLNGFTPQSQPQPQQNPNMGQQGGQRMPNQPIQQPSQPQLPRNDSFNPAQAQQAMQYPGAGDTQRQIEAVSASLSNITDNQLQAMKQRQRSGLVTPQQNNGSALPLPSPQPGQSMQQQQQLPGGITPSHHHRTLSHSSSVQPPIPQPPQQQQQQSQAQQQQSQQQQQQGQAAGIFTMVQGWDNDHLEKATASMLSKVAGTSNVSLASVQRLPLT
jgi:hypothetical protein